jgi:hypothetical protein
MTLEIQVQDKDRHKYVAGYNHPPLLGIFELEKHILNYN